MEDTEQVKNENEPDIFNIVQELGKSYMYPQLIRWFGDYSLYERAFGVTDKQILDAYEDYKQQNESKERTIKLKLSDSDCDSLIKLAGQNGLSTGMLLSEFIGDLVDSINSNGSDERMYAQQWFERCGFEDTAENTLLKHLLDTGIDPEEYIDKLDEIEGLKNDKKNAAENPDKYNEEELSFIDDDIEKQQEELELIMDDWEPYYKPDMKEEIENIKQWIMDKEVLKGKPDIDLKSRLNHYVNGNHREAKATIYEKVGDALEGIPLEDKVKYFKENIAGGEALLNNYIEENICANEINKIKDKTAESLER